MTEKDKKKLTKPVIRRLVGKKLYGWLSNMTVAQKRKVIRALDEKLARQNANSPNQTGH